LLFGPAELSVAGRTVGAMSEKTHEASSDPEDVARWEQALSGYVAERRSLSLNDPVARRARPVSERSERSRRSAQRCPPLCRSIADDLDQDEADPDTVSVLPGSGLVTARPG